ncbi:MAG TPA: LppP/LprE family lipoprotein [Candidatus Binatia bacterium]|nr:LppP/LprE family lipoprotein [Candidatus Binatia bacterium]
MKSKLVRVITFVSLGTIAGQAGNAQVKVASWLDESKPASWNELGRSIPAAPRVQGPIDSRCQELARPAEWEEDRRVRDQGWDLDGAYQGGWHILVIRGTASYDGMCRPWQYQAFVFVRGVFAGTLSPEPMNSRTDGALTQVLLAGENRLTAEYVRYSAKDPACCPSRRTHVIFEVARDGPGLRPVSATTSSNR